MRLQSITDLNRTHWTRVLPLLFILSFSAQTGALARAQVSRSGVASEGVGQGKELVYGSGEGSQRVLIGSGSGSGSGGTHRSSLKENAIEKSPAGWVDPRPGGGRMLDFATKRKGEPMNVIISGYSDPYILSDEGLKSYSKSIGFSPECLGLHAGGKQSANLGDGNGRQDQHYLARQAYFDTIYGPCWESLIGGNHFRAWKQNGTDAHTDAWFLAVSKELFIGKGHTIAQDGYNLGRDWLVARAITGGSWEEMSWIAEVEWVDDLLEPGWDGINHDIPQDGRVAVLTVQRVSSV